MAEKITRKDYEKCGSIRIENSKSWNSFCNEYLYFSPPRPDIFDLFSLNKDRFKRWWGVQSVVWDGWVRNWIWKIPLPNGYLYAISSKRGSTYEVVPNDLDLFEVVCQEAISLLKEKFDIR